MKGLVFRARSALIARREAREASCESIREQLANLRGGSLRRSELRLHLRECPGCRAYREKVKEQRQMLAAALPVVPTLGLKSSVLAAIGIGGGSTGGLTAAAAGLGGATVAKVAVAGVLAGGGVVAGTAVVESERPADGTPPAAQEAERAAPRTGADRTAAKAVDRGPSQAVAQSPRPAGRGQAYGGAPRVDRGTRPARGRPAPRRGRGGVDQATKVTPVKRGPPAKPWRGERGAQPAPRGLAKGHAKGAPGPKAGAKQGPREIGRRKPGGNANGSPRVKPLPAPRAKPNGTGTPKRNGPASFNGPARSRGTAKSKGTSKSNVSPSPDAGANGLARPAPAPKAKADAVAPGR